MAYELDTLAVATDGIIGLDPKRKFYKAGFGFSFNHEWWFEITTVPVVPPVQQTYGGGIVSIPKPIKPVVQQPVVTFYLKTPQGIVSKRYELNKVSYKFAVTFFELKEKLPKIFVKQINFVSDIVKKIKVRLKLL